MSRSDSGENLAKEKPGTANAVSPASRSRRPLIIGAVAAGVVVVLALGTNASISMDQLSRALALVGFSRSLVLVTPRELGGGSGSDASNCRAFAKAHPGHVFLLDWVAFSAGHSSWFARDGIHLGPAGAAGMATLLARARLLHQESSPVSAARPGPRRPAIAV